MKYRRGPLQCSNLPDLVATMPHIFRAPSSDCSFGKVR